MDEVPDPQIEQPTDAIVRVTSSGICGSDLHLYEVMAPFMEEDDILGHEPIGIVEEVGSEVDHIGVGDRVVVPFNISCGHCYMCGQGLFSQCETTQVREQGKGAALFGYTKLYPMTMMELFDEQIQLRMGQANVKRWIGDRMPLVERDDDPLGVEDLASTSLRSSRRRTPTRSSRRRKTARSRFC